MKKILVVVDMQNDFIDGALGTPEAQAIVDKVAEKIKNFDGEIFATLDTHTEDYMNTLEGKKLPVPHCIKGTKGWELNPKIEAALKTHNYTMVEKPTFGSVGLVEEIYNNAYLIDEKIFEITLIGLCTDICVVSNALLLRANFRNVEIFVDSSCCAGVTPQTHDAALQTMRCCQINVL